MPKMKATDRNIATGNETAGTGYFMCRNSNNLRNSFVCNGRDGCGDGSDEIPCVNITGKCNQTDRMYMHGETHVEVGCIFQIFPAQNLTVTCQKGDTLISPSDRILYQTRRQPDSFSVQLRFTPILRRDRGNYSCNGRVDESSREIPFSMQVFEHPTVTLFPSTLSLLEGDQKNLTCKVTNTGAVKTIPARLVWCGLGGSIIVNIIGKCNQTDQTYISGETDIEVSCIFQPSRNLTVTCQKGDNLISPTDRILHQTRRQPDSASVQLKFTPILRRDRGNYSCKGIVDESSREISFFIKVFENPTVTLFPSSLSLREGDHKNLTCKVTNTRAVKTIPARLVWCRPGGSIIDKSKIVRVREGTEVMMLNSTDAPGSYLCGVTKCTETATLVIVKPKETLCPEITDSRGTEWPETVVNTTLVLPCPDGFLGNVRRVCGVTGEWEDLNYVTCVREEIAQIEEEVASITEGMLSSEAVENALLNLQEVTKVNDSSAGDLDKSIDLVDTLAAAVSKSASTFVVDTSTAQSFVNVVDNILSLDTSKEDWRQIQKSNATKASSLMRAVTSFGLAAAASQTVNKPLTINSSTMVMEVAKVKRKDITFPTENLEGVKSSLRLSQENYDPDENVSYVAAYYETMAEFLQRNDSGGDDKTTQKEIRSQILSLAVQADGKRLTELDTGITLNFYHGQVYDAEIECGYWNFDNGSWRTDGCKRRHINSSFSRCDCDHLTNFAILMSPTRVVSGESLRVLKIISIVGCSLSILGCLVTVLTHACLWRNVRSSKSVILVNLCMALTLAYGVFLAGVERTENKVICTAVAAILHYLLLVVFCLMFAQGIDMARQALTVSRNSSRPGIVLALSWGVPAVIVGITLGVTKLEGYGNDQFCWLTVEDGVLYALAGPALFIILANTVLIVVIMRVLFSTKMMIRKGNREKFMISFRSLCVLMPVLGVTWVFGILAFNQDTVFFQYLFAIFNSSQGFLIFVMHCIFNTKVLAGLRTVLQRYISQICESFESKEKRKQKRSDKFSDFTSSRGDLTEGTSTTGVTSQGSTTNPTSLGIEMSAPSQECARISEEISFARISEENTMDPFEKDLTRLHPGQLMKL
ncbi:adhesion G protein-coupled receptor B1-like [Haliotis asinina]|uniref:adhesion G protein-coupled receptor B1-like n=1 Tax=Haliotis asinina TaxID=109174 RepID=UPI0035318C25